MTYIVSRGALNSTHSLTHLITVTIRVTVIIVTHCRMHLPHPRPHLRRLTHWLLLELYPLACQLVLVSPQWLHITTLRGPAMPVSGVC